MRRYWIVRVLILTVTPESITIAYCATVFGMVVYGLASCGGALAHRGEGGASIDRVAHDTSPSEADLRSLRESGTPLQKDFANGVFKKGDFVEALIEKYKPDTSIRQPPFQTYYYRGSGSFFSAFAETRIIAKDGRLIHASTRPGEGTFSPWTIRFFGEGIIDPKGYTDTLSIAFDDYAKDFRSASKAVVGSAFVETQFKNSLSE